MPIRGERPKEGSADGAVGERRILAEIELDCTVTVVTMMPASEFRLRSHRRLRDMDLGEIVAISGLSIDDVDESSGVRQWRWTEASGEAIADHETLFRSLFWLD